MGFIKKDNAVFFLFLNAILWGSSYVWSKMLLDFLPHFSILFICSIGGLIATIILFRTHINLRLIKLNTIITNIVISFFSVISNTFFIFALQYTGSSNTAFIVQTSVIITPLLMCLAEKKKPQLKIILSGFTALAGIFLFTCDLSDFRLNIGDFFAFGNALFFSMHLAGLKFKSHKIEPVSFTMIHQLTNTIAFFILAVSLEVHNINFIELKSLSFIVLISISMIISVSTILIQSTAIKYVQAEKVTLIYTIEPVTALGLAYLFTGEALKDIKSIIGCILILSAVVYTVHKPKLRIQEKNVVS